MLSSRLISLRKQKKLTQAEQAKYINVARTTYAMYEQGKREPDYETLDRIANFHGVTTDYLLGRNPNRAGVSLAFEDGGESLTPDEEEHLEAELKKYRELKKRFMSEKNRDNS